MPRLPCLILMLLCGACGPSERWDAIDWDLESTDAGWYSGELYFEARARVGPVPIRSAECSNEARVWMSWDSAATGALSCDFGGEVGELSVDMSGESTELPLIDGTIDAEVDGEPVEAEWNGGFTAEDAFFGEINGSRTIDGISVRFEGWFELRREQRDDAGGGNSTAG